MGGARLLTSRCQDEDNDGNECGDMNESRTEIIRRVSQQVLKYQRQGGKKYVGGQLKIVVEVKNLAPEKIVCVRYTDDGWFSWKECGGVWSGHDAGADTDEFVVHTE